MLNIEKQQLKEKPGHSQIALSRSLFMKDIMTDVHPRDPVQAKSLWQR
jgi:hypothetical protein